jgi:hypothetical protein
MATVRKEIATTTAPEDAWDAIRDFGALHTRLVKGFVVDTKLDGDDRIVVFGQPDRMGRRRPAERARARA